MEQLGVILARASSQEMGSRGPGLLNVWIYFNLISNTIFLPILAATFLFSKTAKRNPALVNVLMTWIIAGFFSLLLFYGGFHVGPEPPKSLCIAQASLLYGITPMWSVALFALVLHMFMLLRGVKSSRARMVLMIIAPYLTFAVFFWAALVISWRQPKRVSRNRKFFYCSAKSGMLSKAMTVFTLIMCIAILSLQGLLARTVYITWKGLRHVRTAGLGLEAKLIIRIFVFGAYIFFGMIVGFVNLFDSKSILPDMYTATIGTVVFLVFGTHADVFNVWCFWRGTKVEVVEISPGDHSIDLLKSAAPFTDIFRDAEKYPVPPLPAGARTKPELLLTIPAPAHATRAGFSPIQLVRVFTASNTASFKRKMRWQRNKGKESMTAGGSSFGNRESQWEDGPETPLILQPAPTRVARQAGRRGINLADVV